MACQDLAEGQVWMDSLECQDDEEVEERLEFPDMMVNLACLENLLT